MTDVECFAIWYVTMLLLWFIHFVVTSRRSR